MAVAALVVEYPKRHVRRIPQQRRMVSNVGSLTNVSYVNLYEFYHIENCHFPNILFKVVFSNHLHQIKSFKI